MASVFDNLTLTSRDPFYPMTNNQDENILVEFNGIIHSEAERIFYGMKDSILLEVHPFKTYRRLLKCTTDQIYEEIAYFRPIDLIRYLNDGEDIEDGEINAIIEYANLNYDYSIATLLSMAGAIGKLFQSDYLKNVTFVMPDDSKNNYLYLLDLYTPDIITKKCNFLIPDNDQSVIDSMKKEILDKSNSKLPYTTIITNEYQLILDVLKDYKKYNAATALFLLRNHSQNMEQSIKGDSVFYKELHTEEIIGAINGDVSKSKLENLDFPVKAKFGRFKPFPYGTGSPSFMTYA